MLIPSPTQLEATTGINHTPEAYFAGRALDRFAAMIALGQVAARGFPLTFYLVDEADGDNSADNAPHGLAVANPTRALHEAANHLRAIGWSVTMWRIKFEKLGCYIDPRTIEPFVGVPRYHYWQVCMASPAPLDDDAE